MEELTAAGTTLVYATHYMEEVERLCQDVCVVDHGRVIASGTTAELVGNTDRGADVPPEARGGPKSARARGPQITHLAPAGLRVATAGTDELELTGADLATLTQTVSTLTAAGHVISVETYRPTLEERFLELTGEGMRD